MTLPLEARLALEWYLASGERTQVRLMNLVAHFCETNGIQEPDTKAAIYDAARLSLAKKGL